MRIRVRFSLQGDAGSSVRNDVILPNLVNGGFTQGGSTGTWQADGVPWGAAALALANVFTSLQDQGAGRIDHVWLYVENDAGQAADGGDGGD